MSDQLPHDRRGEPLCRHSQPGRCNWWCSYRRGVLCFGPVFAALITLGVVMWLTGGTSERARVAQAIAGISLLLAVSVPIVIYVNARSEHT